MGLGSDRVDLAAKERGRGFERRHADRDSVPARGLGRRWTGLERDRSERRPRRRPVCQRCLDDHLGRLGREALANRNDGPETAAVLPPRARDVRRKRRDAHAGEGNSKVVDREGRMRTGTEDRERGAAAGLDLERQRQVETRIEGIDVVIPRWFDRRAEHLIKLKLGRWLHILVRVDLQEREFRTRFDPPSPLQSPVRNAALAGPANGAGGRQRYELRHAHPALLMKTGSRRRQAVRPHRWRSACTASAVTPKSERRRPSRPCSTGRRRRR